MPTINSLRIGNEEYKLNTRICLKRMTEECFYELLKKGNTYYEVSKGLYINIETGETILVYNENNIVSKENYFYHDIANNIFGF